MADVQRVNLRDGDVPIQFASPADEAAYHRELEALLARLPEGGCAVAPRLHVVTTRSGPRRGGEEVSVADFVDEYDDARNLTTAAMQFDRLLRSGHLVRRY